MTGNEFRIHTVRWAKPIPSCSRPAFSLPVPAVPLSLQCRSLPCARSWGTCGVLPRAAGLCLTLFEARGLTMSDKLATLER